ncbi:MAG: DUF1854 domain-containing protein [Planctomycetota bacterium]|jgi:hypothetical protein
MDAGKKEERAGPSPEDDATGTIRWLSASEVKLFRDRGGHVRATVARERSVLQPALHRAFPATAPHLHVQLREQGGKAVGMLKDLSELDGESRELAEELLRDRYVVPVISEIQGLRHEVGLWAWRVDTDRGEREFGMKSPRDDLRRLAGGRVRITDVHGNTYEIRDLDALDGRSRSLFGRIG